MRADQIMTRRVITCSPDASIVEAAETMLRHHISGLPVVDAAGRLVGIVSQGDFIRRAEIGTERKRRRWLGFLVSSGKSATEFVRERGRKVHEIMTPNPHTITEHTQIEAVAKIMESRNIKRLPVLRGTELVGIVTRSNLVQAVAHLARDVPQPTDDDDHIRDEVIAAIACQTWSPSLLNVIVHDGVATLFGYVTDDRARSAAIVAAENVSGVRDVHDYLSTYPPPEEELGGGDIASLEEEPETADDMSL
jgi:CBS domain-containing protein